MLEAEKSFRRGLDCIQHQTVDRPLGLGESLVQFAFFE